jgi:hypothetical protein
MSQVDWKMVDTLLNVVSLVRGWPTLAPLGAEAMDALSAISVDVATARKKFAEDAKAKAAVVAEPKPGPLFRNLKEESDAA